MATSVKTNKTASKKDAPTYTPSNGETKTAFKVPVPGKVEHYLPAVIRPYIVKIGSKLSNYSCLINDMVTESLTNGYLCGLINPGREYSAEAKKDIASFSYYMQQVFIILGKYDFSGKFPAISEGDCEDINEYLGEAFNCASGYTYPEFSQQMKLFDGMAINACLLGNFTRNRDEPYIDIEYCAHEFTNCATLTKLAYALYDFNKEQAKQAKQG